jgi:hypothetical protein
MPKPPLLSDPRRRDAVIAIAAATDIFSLQRSHSLEVSERSKALLRVLIVEARALVKAEEDWQALSDYRQEAENAKRVATARKLLDLPPEEMGDITAFKALEKLEGKAAERKVQKAVAGWRKGDRRSPQDRKSLEDHVERTARWVEREEKWGRPRK